MKRRTTDDEGFALVIVLTLLAILVLATYAISLVAQVGTDLGVNTLYQTQARQNALLGMRKAMAELQVEAGPDYRITGIAGITGVAPNANNSTRHWCGVWLGDGTFLQWLTSGADEWSSPPSIRAGLEVVKLFSTGSMGAATSNSEHIIAGALPIQNSSDLLLGRYAYVVTDEGVKISAYAPNPVLSVAPKIFASPTATPTNAQVQLRDAISAYPEKLSLGIDYESLTFLKGIDAPLTRSVLQDNRHHVTLGSRFLVSDELRTGMININTNSVHGWRSIIQAYNNLPNVVTPIVETTVSSRGTTVQNGIAGYTGQEKASGGPYQTIDAFRQYFRAVFPITNTPTADQILDEIEPMLSVRSDTFRIRAYGDAINPADANHDNPNPEAVAYCEVIVQRLPEVIDSPDGPLGRRFVITYFRWLGPDDI